MKINYKNGYTVEVLDSENENLDDIVMKAYGAMRHTKTINDATAEYSTRKTEKVSDSATFGKKTKKVSDSATFGKKTKKVSDSATFGKKTKKVSDSATFGKKTGKVSDAYFPKERLSFKNDICAECYEFEYYLGIAKNKEDVITYIGRFARTISELVDKAFEKYHAHFFDSPFDFSSLSSTKERFAKACEKYELTNNESFGCNMILNHIIDDSNSKWPRERWKEWHDMIKLGDNVMHNCNQQLFSIRKSAVNDKKTKKVSDSATAKKAKAKDSFTKAFGLPDVEHVVYGDRPGQDELRYNGKIYDYDEIKEQIMDIYLEENEHGAVPTDEVLAEWVMSDVANQNAVYHILEVTQPLEEEIEYCVSED